MTYDDWKLETPEDERARQLGHPLECPHCDADWEEDIYGRCVACDARLTNQRERDERMERDRE